MKSWQQTLLTIFVSLIFSAAILLVAQSPRGAPVELLPAPTAAPISVHVSGAVREPGVYQLPQGSRVKEAVDAAGGLQTEADLQALNLAARIKDGEKIHIPSEGEAASAIPSRNLELEASEPDLTDIGALVNLNTASLEELLTLPGIGETRAKEIIAYRESHAGFRSIDEIQEVDGIGPVIFERLKDLIVVE